MLLPLGEGLMLMPAGQISWKTAGRVWPDSPCHAAAGCGTLRQLQGGRNRSGRDSSQKLPTRENGSDIWKYR
jgi:hypothetical protein